MAQAQVSPILQFIRKIAAPQPGVSTDGQLLIRFARQRDEIAFAELMRRHGPLVLGVCRRILNDVHDAEDAFQATFLVLVRKAGSISKCQSVASWLYGVAYRLALKAKADRARRHAHEKTVQEPLVMKPEQELICRDLRHVLDEEVNRLPEKYRLPFVLSYLEGRTNQETAQLLNCPPGTVYSRLAWARQRLRMRLARRGLGLSLGAWEMTLSKDAVVAAVPSLLMQKTLEAATFLETSKAVVAGVTTQRAADLAAGLFRSTVLAPWKAATVLAVTLAMLGATVGALSLQLPHAEMGAAETKYPAGTGPAVAASPPSDPWDEEIRRAMSRGTAYLKSTQQGGSWDQHFPGPSMKGGLSSLALLALLESGVETNDEVVRKGLDYLRTIEPRETYVISLQTMVFCRADSKKHQALIQRNVDQLLQTRIRDKQGRFIGWTYFPTTSRITDNSNTQYAVMALEKGSQAGARIEKSVWQEIQEYYLGMQSADGGWSYNPSISDRSTLSMTCAGVSGLAITGRQLATKDQGSEKALARGTQYLGEHFSLENAGHPYYLLHSIGRAGRLTGKQAFLAKEKNETHDWYREGARFLIQKQKENGAWESKNGGENSIVATSFALLFLSQGTSVKF